MTALLEVRNVTKRYGGLLANDSVSLSVNQGEVVGLIGPNGAGKTTLFNCISGTERATSGEILFEQRNLVGLDPEDVCKLGLARTFQVVRTFRDMTVLDNVIAGALLRAPNVRGARRTALEVLDVCGLTHRRDVLGMNLTIADRKRLEIARALATRPKLLLLDEAMAGLNPRERREAVDLVRCLHSDGMTILLVEHVMEVIMPISERVVVLNYGKKLTEDVPERVARNEEVIRAYLGERYRPAG
jgi:branched-chain amino acid transport system ATP-binding protein